MAPHKTAPLKATADAPAPSAPPTANDQLTNRISLQMSPDEIAAARGHIAALLEILKPHLIDLDADDRRALPKMGPKTVDFVSRILDSMRANPLLPPEYVDLDELEIDLDAVKLLASFLQPLQQLVDIVEDTMMLAGSEALGAGLACYHGTKMAARMKVHGAGVVFDSLRPHFAKSRRLVASTGSPAEASTA
jgi:hypothetical protein